MITDDLEDRIRRVILRTLGAPPGDPTEPLAMGLTPGWDSIGHMNVVIELEAEFETSFPAYRLPELVDVPSIAKTLRESANR